MSIRTKKFCFTGKVWLYEGKSAWHFLTLSPSLAKSIKEFVKGDTSAWGSIKVVVMVGEIQWKTSLFPDRKKGSYLLPLKHQVRKKLEIKEGRTLRGTLTIKRTLGFLGAI